MAVEILDFSKINAEPETNKLKPASQLGFSLITIQKKVLADNQFYAAARAIELVENLRNGNRDFTSQKTVEKLKGRLLVRKPYTDVERTSGYEQYKTEMIGLGFEEYLTMEDWLFFSDPINRDKSVPEVLIRFGLEPLESE